MAVAKTKLIEDMAEEKVVGAFHLLYFVALAAKWKLLALSRILL